MMRAAEPSSVLILGGTGFLGRFMARALAGRGHRVTVLSRGRHDLVLPSGVERLLGDRDGGSPWLETLRDRRFDVCIDVCGYTPTQVRPTVELLRDRVEFYLYVSAVMVYGDTKDRPVRETTSRVAPAEESVTEIDGDTYGPLKVACENIVTEAFAGRYAILRPQTVAGPEDPTGRFGYWVQRAARSGPTLVPGDGSDHVQVLDVRDLAGFAAKVVGERLTGAFHLGGERPTWAEFAGLLGVKEPLWVPAEILAAAGLSFVGLPLFRPEHGLHAALMDLDTRKAQAAGFSITPLEQTIRDVAGWTAAHPSPLALSAAKEGEILRALG